MSASKWDDCPVLAFDLETTGVSVHLDRIVQAAIIRIKPGADDAETTWLVNPGIDIPEGATAVHGITTERARAEGGDPAQMLFELTGRLALWMGHGFPVVGMNLSYDLSLLEAENRRHGVDTLASRLNGQIRPVVDVLVLDKYADPYRRGGRKLTQLCEVYGVPLTDAHDAAADARAAALLFPKVMAKHARKFPGMTLIALHNNQVVWRRDQQRSLREYFDKQGTEHDGVCGSWPVHGSCCAPTEAVSA